MKFKNSKYIIERLDIIEHIVHICTKLKKDGYEEELIMRLYSVAVMAINDLFANNAKEEIDGLQKTDGTQVSFEVMDTILMDYKIFQDKKILGQKVMDAVLKKTPKEGHDWVKKYVEII